MHIVGAKKKEAGFVRRDGHSLEVGVVVAYMLPGLPFQILAHRHGVHIRGEFPIVTRQGIEVLNDTLLRAVRHHEHLASFPMGEKQAPLPEMLLEAEEAQRNNPIVKPDTVQ